MEARVKALVLATDYSHPDGKIILHYIHMRNLYYVQHGIDVTVLNFRARQNYKMDEIPVITLKDYNNNNTKYDILICHAPNIRNHYRFLKRYQKLFPRIVFVFHGHEVVRLNTYPKPYSYVSRSIIKKLARDIYDRVKLKIWRYYLPSVAEKSNYIFVSKWIQDEFYRWTKIDSRHLLNKCSIINNAVGPVFETQSYGIDVEKKYDFITIRGNIDGAKYGIDIVNKLAMSNPGLSFLVVGKGEFFEHISKAKNLVWMEGTLSHEAIKTILDKCRCALMPTRHDTQGLMSCELATYGMPLITSDIPVCNEIFDNMSNVALISNENTSLNLQLIMDRLISGLPYQKDERYFAKNTVRKEIELIRD